MTKIDNTLEAWHKILSDKNPAGLDRLLAENAVFHSPVIPEPQRGKELTTMYLTAAFQVLGPSIQYVRQVQTKNDAVLEFTAEVNGTQINGVDMLHWDDNGLITDFKVMVRPLPAIEVLKKQMRRELVRMARASRDAE